MSCFHFSTREWCQTVPAIPCKQNVHLVFSLSKRFVAHRSPLVLHQMCVGMGWRSRHLSVGRTPHTLLPSSMLGLPPACLWECAAAHLWHATIAMPQWAFHLITACDVLLLQPQTKTCHLISGASDRADGFDSAVVGQLPESLTFMWDISEILGDISAACKNSFS